LWTRAFHRQKKGNGVIQDLSPKRERDQNAPAHRDREKRGGKPASGKRERWIQPVVRQIRETGYVATTREGKIEGEKAGRGGGAENVDGQKRMRKMREMHKKRKLVLVVQAPNITQEY